MLSLSVYPRARLEWSDSIAFYHVADSRRLSCCRCCCLVAQWCPTPCDPHGLHPPSSPVHGIFQQEDWSGLPFPSPVVLNILKQNKQIHRVTPSLPLKFYSPYHLPGETSIYLSYLFTSFPVPKVLLPLPFSWLLPILSSHFSLSFTF